MQASSDEDCLKVSQVPSHLFFSIVAFCVCEILSLRLTALEIVLAESAMSEGYQTTVGEAEKEGTKRKGSAFNRRKSSAVPEVPEAIVEAHELSVADRRLAELGYVQVGAPTMRTLRLHHADLVLSHRYTSASSRGCRVSHSHSPSPASSLPSAPPLYTPWKPAGLPPQYGAG